MLSEKAQSYFGERLEKNQWTQCVGFNGGSDWGLSLSGPKGPVRRNPGRFMNAWCPIAASDRRL